MPVPEIDRREGLNIELEQRCRQDPSRKLRGKPAPKGELLPAEKAWFRALSHHEFEARQVKPARANSLSLVRFERNDYSVPTQYLEHRSGPTEPVQSNSLQACESARLRRGRTLSAENSLFFGGGRPV